MHENEKPFLTAAWKYLAMLNYEIEPGLLETLVPPGTELDTWRGKTYVSMVGFLFLDTRVMGLPVPLHRNFEEVNLRFYVRRNGPDGLRRGVVFVKEIVPQRATAWLARRLYHEHYIALPMRHDIKQTRPDEPPEEVCYQWRVGETWNELALQGIGPWQDSAAGSDEEFISEHYWGYTKLPQGGSLEYRVSHPRWKTATVEQARLQCSAAELYGPRFAEVLNGAPDSAFLAQGSEICVYHSRKIQAAAV